VHLPPPGIYRIDSSGSELRLLVYRAGALASLGHNHVILNRSVTGSIDVEDTLDASSFSLRAPIASFVVDESQARTEEGDDFPGEISDEAKTGTWNNMTGPALLNSMQYPVISVRSTRLEQSPGTLTATVTVSVAGHESTLSVPFVLSREDYGLSASASFELRQSALGLTPFSLMLGALAVRDAMQVKLTLAAQM
jgi:polyisoprenoid-binding protein YceI